jgi:hypothetical protein
MGFRSGDRSIFVEVKNGGVIDGDAWNWKEE